jgi:hypothetical protein
LHAPIRQENLAPNLSISDGLCKKSCIGWPNSSCQSIKGYNLGAGFCVSDAAVSLIVPARGRHKARRDVLKIGGLMNKQIAAEPGIGEVMARVAQMAGLRRKPVRQP